MSAPIIACAMVEAIGPLLKTLTETLGAEAYVQYFPKSPSCHSFWSVSIHDHGKCFSGSDETDLVLALLEANGKRQAFGEKLALEAPAELVLMGQAA